MRVGERRRVVEHRSRHRRAVSRRSRPYPEAMPRLRVAAAQLDLVVGDLDGNVDRILDAYEQAEAAGCDLVAFPELAITGYPPEDLLLRPAFVAAGRRGAREGRGAHRPRAPRSSASPRPAATCYNAAAVCAHGRVHGVYRKHLLPNYAVFDEQRYFTPSTDRRPAVRRRRRAGRRLDLRGRLEPDRPDPRAGGGRRRARRQHQRVAVLRGPAPRARDDARDAGRRRVGADRLREPRRRPGRARLRRRVDACSTRAATSSPGRKQFAEDLLVVDLDVRPDVPQAPARSARPGARARRCPRSRSARRTLGRARRSRRGSSRCSRRCTRSTRRSCSAPATTSRKNGFTDVLIGALGRHRLVARRRDRRRRARRRARRRRADAVALLERGQRHRRRGARREPRASARSRSRSSRPTRAFLDMLAPSRSTAPSRAWPRRTSRPASAATILMTISNKFGWMVLTTGNKSEMATGYATLYGDMAGGFAVIKDVPKMLVYALCRDRNERAGRDAHPRAVHREAAERRAAARPEGHRLAARRTTCSTRSSRATSRTTCSIAELEAAGYDPEHRCAGSRGWSTATSTSAARRRRACGCRRRRSARTGGCPITNRWPG